MEKLTVGQTVFEAMEYLVDCEEIQVKDSLALGYGRLLRNSDLALYDDANTGLTKVYTGDGSTSTGWYRMIGSTGGLP